MSYFNTYLSRINRYGGDSKERAQTFVRKEYEKFIKQSPTREIVIINNEKIECSIQTERFRDEKNLKFLVTKYSNEFPLGSLVHRPDTQNEIWMLLRHEPHPFGGDNRYIIIQLKHHIQWVDDYGVLQNSPCMIVGTMDAKIKENFRTWNSMITPQPNKVLEIIMPYQFIKRTTKILSNEEAWYLVDYDKQTIPGIIYLSFTESGINLIDDDIEENIGDKDKIGIFEIVSENPITISPNVLTPLNIKVLKKGNEVFEELLFEYDDTKMLIQDNSIQIGVPGEYSIQVSLVSQPKLVKTIQIQCTSNIVSTDYSIFGDESIKWGRKAVYYVGRTVNGILEIKTGLTLELKTTNLATIQKVFDKEQWEVKANTNNKIGPVTMFVEVDGIVLEKEIQITSLWS